MEQTSSSAYPSILVVDYVKKARVASPEILMKAENYLNIGYQKLLTFERPGGGFDYLARPGIGDAGGARRVLQPGRALHAMIHAEI